MKSSHTPSRIKIAFDDDNLVANAGLLLPAVLAEKLGLTELFDECVDLGDAPGRANVGIKAMSLIYSFLAGGDCIDDADQLRAGSTQTVLGSVIRAASTLGIFLRSFTWGHTKQLEMVVAELLKRAWACGAGPGDTPLTIDRLNYLRDLRSRQGGRERIQLHACSWIPSPDRRCLRHGRYFKYPAAQRPGQYLPGRLIICCRDDKSGQKRRGQWADRPSGRFGLLQSVCGRRLPQEGGSLLHHRQAKFRYS